MDAQFVEEGAQVANIDNTVKNKWRWAWLDEVGEGGRPIRSWCKKLKVAGACMCVLCHKKLVYGSNGKKVLIRHQSDGAHRAAVRSLAHTSSLPGASAATTETQLSMADRVCDLKIRVCGFIAEHDLSLTLSQPLVELINGDTVHMVSNAAKALLVPFGGYVEDFSRKVYCDIEKFPKQKELFSEIQGLLHMEPKSVIRPISTRFLQMLDVCNRLQELIDPLIVHYYSILSPADKRKYR
ncbi:hypothetical protein WMY93_004541 [Mugilogobius chulae]|uniref:Uncharacterized protein n=1 Tax=Mugilogobius chulae TaxID=88201 RepID=A0AAW0PV47_9GOBI